MLRKVLGKILKPLIKFKKNWCMGHLLCQLTWRWKLNVFTPSFTYFSSRYPDSIHSHSMSPSYTREYKGVCSGGDQEEDRESIVYNSYYQVFTDKITIKQARKLGKCDSYLWNLKLWPTDSLTHSLTGLSHLRILTRKTRKAKIIWWIMDKLSTVLLHCS